MSTRMTPEAATAALREAKPVDAGSAVNALEEAAHSALDDLRRTVAKLGELAYMYREEPFDEAREMAWGLYRLEEFGAADRWAAELYLATDPEQQQAIAAVASDDVFAEDAWRARLTIPAEATLQGESADVEVRFDGRADQWRVVIYGTGGRPGRGAQEHVLRKALWLLEPKSHEWPDQAERQVIAEALAVKA